MKFSSFLYKIKVLKNLLLEIYISIFYFLISNLSIAKNTYGSVRFRLNFYSLNQGVPDENLLDETWRENFVQGVRNGIIKWVGEDSIVAPLRRQ